MTVIIDLSPETEATLAEQARAHGLALPEYVQQLLEEQAFVRAQMLTPAERAAAWRPVEGLPIRPPLSDKAISRDSIYDLRG
jgi:hypothetical protein